MAKILGFNPEVIKEHDLQTRVNMQEKLIEELIRLNESYEEEVKRLVNEYDKLYAKYQATQIINI